MSNVNDKMFKLTAENLLYPKTTNTKSTEGNSSKKPGKNSMPGTDRPAISESVSKDSMPGWVKKNINQVEVTEGRV